MKKIFIIIFLTFILTKAKSQEDSLNSCIKYLNEVKTHFTTNADLITDSIVANNQLFFIGESHGFKDNYTISYRLIEELKRKTDFKYILSEMDFASTEKLNNIVKQRDTTDLYHFMIEFKGSPAWCKERYEFYKKIIELNEEYERKIQFLGVDIASGGIKSTLIRIGEISKKYDIRNSYLDSIVTTPNIIKSKLNFSLIKQLHDNSDIERFEKQDAFQYKYHLNNILNYNKAANAQNWDLVRDSCIYENYRILEKYYGLQNEKMIGSWGYTHGLQQQTGRIKWLASRLKNNLGKQVYTYRIFYLDSKSMFPANWVPSILKVFKSKKKLYYNVKLQNDDHWASGYKQGLEYLKKISPSEAISFFDLEKYGSPYRNGEDLVMGILNNTVTTDYFQTAIVVRNSKPTEPFGRNRK